MARKLNKTCVVCGSKYTYCPSCNAYKDEPTWKNVICSNNCKELYDICVAFRDNKITAEEANIRLKKCNLKGLKDFDPTTQDMIEKIQSGVKKAEKDVEPETKEVKEKKFFKKED